MKSYLYLGPKKPALKKAKKQAKLWLKTKKLDSCPDFFKLEANGSIKISQVRDLIKKITQKSYQGEGKVVLINQAQLMTLSAQNAILKTLEEPPANTYLILTAPSQDRILPTIISRCQLVKIRSKKAQKAKPEIIKSLKEILSAPLGKRMRLVEPFTKSRQKALLWLRQLIKTCHYLIVQNQAGQHQLDLKTLSKIIKTSQKAYQDVEKNLNLKLCLDNLVINW